MKLSDLRRQHREEPAVQPDELRRFPVDELDDLLISKGTMSPPEPFKGRRADVLIIDDPIARVEPVSALTGPPGPVDYSKPVNVEMMLMRGKWARKLGSMVDPFLGTIVYDPEEDDLCKVLRIEDPAAGTIAVWYGLPSEGTHSPRTKAVHASQLYVVEHKPCHGCIGAPPRSSVKCFICNGLRVVPTQKGLKPWSAEKARRASEYR